MQSNLERKISVSFAIQWKKIICWFHSWTFYRNSMLHFSYKLYKYKSYIFFCKSWFFLQINLISCRKDETSRSMMINFVDVLNTILAGNEKMDLGEFNFIGGWIDRYLLECQKNRIGSLLEMIANVFEKCIILQVSCNNSGWYVFVFISNIFLN